MPRWSGLLRRPAALRPEGLVGRYLPELVYGASDGIVTTFAIVSSIVGAGLSTATILVLGFASLFADGISMAVGNVLSERSKAGEPPPMREAARHGAATFTGFIVAGLTPLLAYLLPAPGIGRFGLAIVLAAAALFLIGASRAAFTRLRPLRAGAEMLLLGAAAGGVAYGAGRIGAALVSGV